MIALARRQSGWAVGFQDETWWSRLAQPNLSAWSPDDQPLRLVEQSAARDDPDPKALACYGLLVRAVPDQPERVWLRFVEGRPVSAVTTAFLDWCARRLAARGVGVWVLIWDNAAWHVSRQVRSWLRAHNQHVKRTGTGVRIIACYLPTKSPWLNAIEPKWTHAQRRIVEPDRLLTAQELAGRVCAALACPHEPHLTMPKEVA